MRALKMAANLIPAVAYHWYWRQNGDALRSAIIRAGPVWIKFAQWIAERPDLLSPALVEALTPLQNHTCIHPWEWTRQILEEEDMMKYFEYVEQSPIASGSVGQAHLALLKKKKRRRKVDDDDVDEVDDGEEREDDDDEVDDGDEDDDDAKRQRLVVIKVLHPGVDDNIEQDIDGALFILNMFVNCGSIDFSEMRRSILMQVDLRIEAKNLEELHAIFEHCPTIVIPKPIITSKRALVETFVPGTSFEEFFKKYPERADEAISARMAAYITMGWFHNTLHSDMHAGNVRYELNKKTGKVHVGFVDGGVVARLENRQAVRRFVREIFTFNPKRIADLVIDMNTNKDADEKTFYEQVSTLGSQLIQDEDSLKGYRMILESANIDDCTREMWHDDFYTEDSKVIVMCSENMIRIIRCVLSAINKCGLVVPADLVILGMSFIIADGDSARYTTKNVFRGAFCYIIDNNLYDLMSWIGRDISFLLQHDPLEVYRRAQQAPKPTMRLSMPTSFSSSHHHQTSNSL